MQLTKNQIVLNVLTLLGGQTQAIECRVIEPSLKHLGSEPMARLCDARETRDDAWLIANNRTWAAPLGNIRQLDGGLVHSTGLVVLGGVQ